MATLHKIATHTGLTCVMFTFVRWAAADAAQRPRDGAADALRLAAKRLPKAAVHGWPPRLQLGLPGYGLQHGVSHQYVLYRCSTASSKQNWHCLHKSHCKRPLHFDQQALPLNLQQVYMLVTQGVVIGSWPSVSCPALQQLPPLI